MSVREWDALMVLFCVNEDGWERGGLGKLEGGRRRGICIIKSTRITSDMLWFTISLLIY